MVVYFGADEVIVFRDLQEEKDHLREWFEHGGRSYDDYDREVKPDVISFRSVIQICKQ